MEMQWSGNGTQGFVVFDEEGHPTKVICSYGSGSYESGAEYSVEEVIFCPGTQKTVRENCGEKTFPQLMTLLANRKVPEGMYVLPDAAKRALSGHLPGDVPDWKAIHTETGGKRRRLMRSINGAMAWVHPNGRKAATTETFVEGLDAQALDVEFSFLFPGEEQKRIEETLVKGVNGLKAMQNLFGKELAGLSLLSEKTDAYNNWKRQEWHIQDRGVIHLEVNGKGKIESFQLRERGEAYIVIRGLSRF